jgi:hypothetical protein
MNLELSILDSILYPMEAHVHDFGSLDLGVLVGKAISCGVVCGESSGFQLLSAYFFENLSGMGPFLACGVGLQSRLLRLLP